MDACRTRAAEKLAACEAAATKLVAYIVATEHAATVAGPAVTVTATGPVVTVVAARFADANALLPRHS